MRSRTRRGRTALPWWLLGLLLLSGVNGLAAQTNASAPVRVRVQACPPKSKQCRAVGAADLEGREAVLWSAVEAGAVPDDEEAPAGPAVFPPLHLGVRYGGAASEEKPSPRPADAPDPLLAWRRASLRGSAVTEPEPAGEQGDMGSPRPSWLATLREGAGAGAGRPRIITITVEY